MLFDEVNKVFNTAILHRPDRMGQKLSRIFTTI